MTAADLLDMSLKAIPILLSFAAMIVAVIRTRRSEVDERFKAGSDRMDRHEARIARAEQTISGMPSKDDVHSIQLSIAEMSGSLNRMEAVIGGNAQIMQRLETIVSRHEDHLLNDRNRP
ncbi:DUF2730 family protein [Mameliella sp. MMSF_3552]|uniref:DUF2730 family protein n=2 Tax=Mameliella TaxID=1434019 RepID=UPI00273E46F4|nr:DUF2730 family protein [Mameliella sp. MMSF_3552]